MSLLKLITSLLARREIPGGAPEAVARPSLIEEPHRAGVYLTDGVNLYRCLGEICSCMGRIVGLENCRSLEVTLLPIGEVRARPLRAVMPTSAESPRRDDVPVGYSG